MKQHYLTMLSVCIVLIIICLIDVYRMKDITPRKRLARDVKLLLLSLYFPVVGNMLIVAGPGFDIDGPGFEFSVIGYYLYLIGTDLIFYFLLRFILDYCGYDYKKTASRKAAIVITVFDMISVLLNLVWNHVFVLSRVHVPGFGPYYILSSRPYHYIHMFFNYAFFFYIMGIMLMKIIKSSSAYREKYIIILFFMVVTTAWETYYVMASVPVDNSIVGYAVCGILIYYFGMRYIPYFAKSKLLQKVVAGVDDAIFFFDNDGECFYVNESADRMFDINEDNKHESKAMLDLLINNDQIDYDQNFILRRAQNIDGKTYYFKINYYTIKDKHQRNEGSFFVINDYTEEEHKNIEKRFASTHDLMTGMLNKQHFMELVSEKLQKDQDTEYVLFSTDIKDFKLINDIYGTEVGDKILLSIATEIDGNAYNNDISCRLGNDRFAVLRRKQDFDFDEVSARVSEAVEIGEDINYKVVVHIGAYDIVDKSVPVDVMLDRTYMAISQIKQDYNTRIAWYDDTLRDSRIWEQQISAALAEAIEDEQIVPYLQPQINSNGVLEGAEILVRWNHPTEGFLSPARFIPVFEKNGMIAQVDCYMWEAACIILKKWSEQGKKLYLSVNISPKDFYFVDIYETLMGLVKRYDIDISRLHLEITESVMMTDLNNRLEVIHKLKKAGFVVEMDDFGSGFSSLNLLKDMPIDVLKIDMVFLRKSDEQEKAKIIINSIVDMANNLSIDSIAEGVETEEQFDMLVNMGCRLFQGYLFAKPMPLREFEDRYT